MTRRTQELIKEFVERRYGKYAFLDTTAEREAYEHYRQDLEKLVREVSCDTETSTTAPGNEKRPTPSNKR